MDQKELKQRIRFMPTGMKVREADDGAQEPSRVVEGCAIVFNQETTLWEDEREVLREVIDPSACTQEFIDSQDVKLNLLHDRNQTIARCKKREGNMQIEVREDGVYFVAEMPKCDLGDRALEMIRSGVYTGCSFEFYEGEYSTDKQTDADGRRSFLVRHTAFARVSALTLGMDPAYEQTHCAAREYEELTRAEAELLKRQKEEEEAKHQQAREAEDAEARAQAQKRAEMEREAKERELRHRQRCIELDEATK